MGSGIPGYTEGRSITPREIKFGMSPQEGLYLPGGGWFDKDKAIDGGNTGYTYELRAGWICGQITATKKWRPCPRTRVNGTAGAVTAVVVDDSSAFKVGDVITIGSDTTITITAIDYTTHTFTIASTTVADNDVVFCEDGSATARAILDDFVDLQDEEGDAVDQVGKLMIDGKVDQAMLLGDVASIIAAWSTMLLGGIQIYSSGVRQV